MTDSHCETVLILVVAKVLAFTLLGYSVVFTGTVCQRGSYICCEYCTRMLIIA